MLEKQVIAGLPKTPSRRDFTNGIMAAFTFGAAQPAYASYAMYAARQAEWDQRTEYGTKPLTNDVELVKRA